MSVETEVKEKATQLQQIEARIKDLESTSRICKNTLSLLCEMEIKGAYAKPMSEVLDWLSGLQKAIENQIVPLKSLLPKSEEKIIDVPAEPK